MCVSNSPSTSQWLEPSQGAKSLNVRFSLYGKACVHSANGKKQGGVRDTCLHCPAQWPPARDARAGCVSKAVITMACGTLRLRVSDGGKIF